MQYDFNLGPNGGQKFDVAGKFFKYKSGTGAIRVKASRGNYIDLLPGQGVWNSDFSDLMVQDISGAANKGTIIAGSFDFHDDRISGTVDIVDGGKARTIAGGAFATGVGSAAPAAGCYSRAQLWNNTGSGMRCVVESVSIFNLNASAIGVNLVRGTTQFSAVDLGPGVNKNMGIAAGSSVAHFYSDAYQTNTPYGLGQVALYAASVQAGGSFMFLLKEPIVVLPGTALVIWGTTPALPFTVGFEWFEEAI